MAAKARFVQIRNPRTGAYVKIDREEAVILGVKRSKGPYKNVPIIRIKKN